MISYMTNKTTDYDTFIQNEDTAGPVKDSKGRFVKGQSGNPGGCSKEKRIIIDMCKDMSEEAVQTLYTIMKNEHESGKVRILAANSILDRGNGKPGIRKEEGGNQNFIPQQMVINMSKEDYDEYQKEIEDDL